MKEKDTNNKQQSPDVSLLLKYIKNEIADKEKVAIEEWLNQEEENTQNTTRLATLYYALRNYVRISSRDTDKAYEQVRKKIERKKNKYRLRNIATWISAAACILFVYLYLNEKAGIPEREIQEIRLEANAGMRTSVVLPDGSRVYLNSGTVITYEYPFYEERKITISGEAFFQVKENKDKPFIVTSPQGDLSVEVTGTEFNVQAFDNEPIKTVTLVSGKVILGVQKEGKTIYRAMSPAEKAIVDMQKGTLDIHNVHVDNEIAWKDGRIVFKETPLPEVLKKLSYFYSVRFDVKDEIINKYTFTGTFDNRQLSQVLEYLKISSKINFRIDPPAEDDSNGKKYSTVILWK